MKFEELESTWALQHPVIRTNDEARTLSFLRQMRRRSWRLNTVALSVVAGLLLVPLLAIVSRSTVPATDQLLPLVRLFLHQGVYLAVLVYLVRRIRRERSLVRAGPASVRTMLVSSLASVEDEMLDYRMARWAAPVLVAQSLFSAYLNHPVTHYGWSPFALRSGLVLAFTALVGLTLWRHYRVNLRPGYERLKANLERLDSQV